MNLHRYLNKWRLYSSKLPSPSAGFKPSNMAESITKSLKEILRHKSKSFSLLQDAISTSSFKPEILNTSVKTHVPALRCHMNYTSLNLTDFTNIAPECAPLKVINGRFASNLRHTNDYFLIFKCTDELQEYFRYTQGTKINELDVRFKEMNDFVHYFRFMYPNYMPDLDDLGDLLTLARKSAIINDKSKAKELRSSLKLLLEKRKDAYSRYDLPNGFKLLEYSSSLSHFITKKYGSFTLRFPQISRDNCVILNNYPANIRLEKIVEFLWDLNWYEDSSLRIRKIFVDKTTHFATLVLCFNSSGDANICVRRLNNKNLFYNKKLPVLSAEVM